MSLSVVTHVNFTGNAREALEFYQSVFGGQLTMATYAQTGVPQDAPDGDRASFAPVADGSGDAGHVSFGMVMAESGFRLAAYDVFGADGGGLASAGLDGASGRAGGNLTHTESFFVALNGQTRAEIEPYWERLAEGGTVIQALAPSDFAPAYGMVTDRFGVTWIFGSMS